MAAEHLEIERKFEVAMKTAIPSMLGLPKVSRVEQVLSSTLEAVYCDTDDLALAAAGITLRRRTGGTDAGWHLKLPRGGDDRAELARPLGDDDAGVPAELLTRVRAWIRDGEPRPVATLSTHRVVHRLISERGRVLAEVSDDVVTSTSTPIAGQALVNTWREWEIELVDGSRKLLTAAAELFTASGATLSIWPSKVHHALDRNRDPLPPAVADLTEKSPAGAVVHAYLAEQVTEILGRDSGVRHSTADAVHRMRVATRRLRSALATFRPLLEREITDPIRGELKWLGATLGGARDVEVQRSHLLEAVAAEPDDLVLGPVAAGLEVELRSDYRTAHDTLVAAMESSRYFQLLERLEHLVAAPPFTELASGKARPVLRQRVSHSCKALYGLASSGEPGVRDSRDIWLHEVRKAAKRVRYAAEVAAPALGRPAAALVAAATALQEILGDHQDSVLIRETLRGIGVRMFLDGENSFTIGRLHALQQTRGVAAAGAFLQLWSGGVAEQVRGWLRY